MSTPVPPVPSESKIQAIIERWGYIAGCIIFSLVIFVYQSDKSNMQETIAAANARITVAERGIGRLQDGKASREELKNSQEASLRELQGLRQDMKDMMSVMRTDYQSRLDYQTRK